MDKHPFRRWLDASGLTVTQVAKACDVSRSAVYLWCSGKTAPTAKHLGVLHKLSYGAVQAWMWTPGVRHGH